MPTTAFVQSQPVNRSAVARDAADGGEALRWPASPRSRRPSRRAARPPSAMRPPASASSGPWSRARRRLRPPAGFAAQQQQLAATPGKPLETPSANNSKTDRPPRRRHREAVVGQPKASVARPRSPPAASGGASDPMVAGKDRRAGRVRRRLRAAPARPRHSDQAMPTKGARARPGAVRPQVAPTCASLADRWPHRPSKTQRGEDERQRGRGQPGAPIATPAAAQAAPARRRPRTQSRHGRLRQPGRPPA